MRVKGIAQKERSELYEESIILIVSGCDDDTNKEVLRLVSVYPNVYGTLGLHPTDLLIFKYIFKVCLKKLF